MCSSIQSKVWTHLNFKTSLPENANHHLVIFLLVEGLGSVLMASDWSGWWLLKVGVSVAISSYFSPLNFWLHWDFVVAHGLSLVAESRSYSLAVVHGLFIVLPPLVVKCGLWDLWAPRTGPGVVVHKLSCPAVYGIFLDHRLNHCPLHCKADS